MAKRFWELKAVLDSKPINYWQYFYQLKALVARMPSSMVTELLIAIDSERAEQEDNENLSRIGSMLEVAIANAMIAMF